MTEIVTAHALQDETAARIRERGTKFFRKAVVADDCETEHNYLRTALALYEEALDASSPAGAERARAHKNISATHNALFRHPDQHKFQRVLSAVTHAADALEAARLASDDLSPSWKEDVKSKFLALLCFVKHARGNSAEAQKTALVRQASKRVRDLPRGIDGKGEACGILGAPPPPTPTLTKPSDRGFPRFLQESSPSTSPASDPSHRASDVQRGRDRD